VVSTLSRKSRDGEIDSLSDHEMASITICDYVDCGCAKTSELVAYIVVMPPSLAGIQDNLCVLKLQQCV
jgi:hypothetical protein